jgi:hypothetical protein
VAENLVQYLDRRKKLFSNFFCRLAEQKNFPRKNSDSPAKARAKQPVCQFSNGDCLRLYWQENVTLCQENLTIWTVKAPENPWFGLA